MTFQKTALLKVFYMRGKVKLSFGRLALKDRKVYFEYDASFLETHLELSPFKLPLKRGVFTPQDSPFEGLFGLFNDSLPDGWGRLLLDRKLMSQGINPGDLSPLDRLRYVGSRGMGALIYEPEFETHTPPPEPDLDQIAEETFQFQEDEDVRFVDDLLALNASSAGARPKIVMRIDSDSWIVKFRSSTDPKDAGAIEYAYHLMAQEAGLEVAEAKLFPSRKGVGYFGSKRFDRSREKRIHMHTVSGLLHADHRYPSLDYETIMRATLWLTRDIRECEKQFRAAAFNVLGHNRDDHAKNLAYLMDEQGTWKVSPGYDLTFSSGPAGEHSTTVMGEGKSPRLSHFIKLSEVVGLKKQKTLSILEDVQRAVIKWETFAKEAGVSKTSSSMICSTLGKILKAF